MQYQISNCIRCLSSLLSMQVVRYAAIAVLLLSPHALWAGQCNDSIDNDGDGKFDYNGGCIPGLSCTTTTVTARPDETKNFTVPCNGTIRIFFYDDNGRVSVKRPGETAWHHLALCDNEMSGECTSTNCCSPYAVKQHGALLCDRSGNTVADLGANYSGTIGCPGNKMLNYPIKVVAGDTLQLWVAGWAAGSGYFTFTPAGPCGTPDPMCTGPDSPSEYEQCRDGKDNDGDGLIDMADPGCSSADDNNESDATSQCQDKKDNDGDGLIDMADPGCSTPQDNNEGDATSQCQDKKDNDGDGLIDMADPGCSTPQDNSESDGTSQCQDKKDNDGDGLIDMADPGCSTPQDYNESDGTSQCQDKKDNDSDGLVDDADPGCWTNILDPTTYDPKLNNESRATAQCQDKKDNDGDGAIDYPSDFSCSAPTDTNEALPKSPCQDGRDNDGDGLIDAADPGCWKDPSNASTYNAQDNDEYHVIAVPACRDGIDNDLDGVTDAADPGCWTNPNDPGTYDDKRDDESCATTQCQDKQDNDTDALVDWEDPGCWSDPNDPSTYDRTRNNEACATTQCQDKKDNDGDSLVDAADPGCRDIPSDPSSYRPRDNDEEDEVIPPSECEDKIDNDGDGLVDQTDPGCWTDPSDPDTFDPDADDEGRSTTQCQDGLDNDGDGLIDFPLDPECSSRTDNSEGEDGGSCGLAATQKIKSVIVTNNHDLGAIAQKNAKVLRKEVRKIRDIPGLTAPTTLERFYQSGLSNVKKTLAALDDLTQQLPEVLNPCPGTKVCSATVSNLKEKNQMVKNTIKLTKLAKRITRRLWYYQQVENPMVPFGSRLATERLEMRRANKQDRKNAEIFKRNLLAAVAEVPDTTKVCS